jgi:hypothetical protein
MKWESFGVLTWTEEFSGTLLGFDDYVSKC